MLERAVKLRIFTSLGVAALAAVPLSVSSAPGASAAPAVSVLPPTVKIRPTMQVTGASDARLVAARNEFVSFQVVIPGGRAGLRSASVTVGAPLRGRTGTIPTDHVTVYREGYYDATQASTASGGTGRWPDVLIPAVDPLYGEARKAFPVEVPSGENRVAFIDILVPASQAPGTYDGSLTVAAEGTTTAVPVRLDVRTSPLPATSSTRSLFKMNWITPCQALHPACSFADEETAWRTNYDLARLGLDNRVTIANPQFQPPVSSTEAGYVDRFMRPLLNGTATTRLAGARMTSLAIDTATPAQVSAWRSTAAAGGFADRAVSYDGRCDEAGRNATRWSACRRAVTSIRSAWPGIPNVVTTSIQDADDANGRDLVDIIAPVIDHIDGKAGSGYDGDQRYKYDDFLARHGTQLWLYTSCDASGCASPGETNPYYRGWVDYTIDTNATQNRAMGWMLYEYRASGELYYATDLKLRTAWTDQWAFGGNGDGTLVYPGTTDRVGGTHPIPLESLRLKMIRNGNQDYEYLRLAEAAGHGREAMAIARALYPSTHDTDISAEAIESARRRLADLIAPGRPQVYTANRIQTPVVVDGRFGDLTGGGSIRLLGREDSSTVKLRWDGNNLYGAFTVSDEVLRTNEGGRDGEVWNGDGVELMIDRNGDRTPTPNPRRLPHPRKRPR
jgi:hypothetical protein